MRRYTVVTEDGAEHIVAANGEGAAVIKWYAYRDETLSHVLSESREIHVSVQESDQGWLVSDGIDTVTVDAYEIDVNDDDVIGEVAIEWAAELGYGPPSECLVAAFQNVIVTEFGPVSDRDVPVSVDDECEEEECDDA